MTRIRGAVDVEAARDTVIDDNRIAHVALAWRDNARLGLPVRQALRHALPPDGHGKATRAMQR